MVDVEWLLKMEWLVLTRRRRTFGSSRLILRVFRDFIWMIFDVFVGIWKFLILLVNVWVMYLSESVLWRSLWVNLTYSVVGLFLSCWNVIWKFLMRFFEWEFCLWLKMGWLMNWSSLCVVMVLNFWMVFGEMFVRWLVMWSGCYICKLKLKWIWRFVLIVNLY